MSSEGGIIRIGPGGIALIVGPSGAGKDALIAGAQARLSGEPTFAFPRRVITRPGHAAEAHTPVSDDAFMETAQGGGFALSWQAHGVRYGIPAGIDEDVRAGRLVVANVSRAIVADAKRRYAFAPVLIVDCPVEIRAERLALRGRERAEEILTRLQRTVDGFDRSVADFIIDNSGTLEAGVSRLVAALNTIAASVSLRV